MDICLTPLPPQVALEAALAAALAPRALHLQVVDGLDPQATALALITRWPEHDACGITLLWPDRHGPALARLCKALVAALGGRAIIDGTAHGDRPGPYWALVIEREGAWLADDAEAGEDPTQVRLVRPLALPTVFGDLG